MLQVRSNDLRLLVGLICIKLQEFLLQDQVSVAQLSAVLLKKRCDSVIADSNVLHSGDCLSKIYATLSAHSSYLLWNLLSFLICDGELVVIHARHLNHLLPRVVG